LIHAWERKGVLGAWLIETSVLDAHVKLPAINGDNDRVGQPPWVVDLPDEIGVVQLLDFFTNEVLSLNRLLSGLLLHRPGIGVARNHMVSTLFDL
jgi:hypothetical protein